MNNSDHQKRYEIEWIGREGLAPETHEEYLNDFINHFYKNVLRWFTTHFKLNKLLSRLVDRAMKREDSSEQGKIVTELMQHLHGCKNNCDVFFGRTEELERMKNYIVRNKRSVCCLY